MLEGLKNWLREQSERQDYIDDMTFRYPSLCVQLLIIAAGCALYALNLIFPALAKAIGAVLFAFYMVYYAFIWAAAKHRPDIGINFSFRLPLAIEAA